MTVPDGPASALAPAATGIGVIANFLAHGPADHPKDVQSFARRAFADTVGCMVLGAQHPDTELVLRTVEGWGTGTAPVIGSDAALAAPWAALVNGTSAHAYDFDDWEDPGITHPSAAIFPALLALAPPNQPLSTIYDAWICGVEVIMRIGEAVNMTHYELGWHATNTLGAVGAAAACARALGVDADRAGNAVSLSTSMMGGFTSQFGTTAKPLHAGLAAKSGVMAASLAAQGATAQAQVFEAEAGVLSAMTRSSAEALMTALAGLGRSSAIGQYGLHTKKYPSCGCTHLVVEACETLRADHGFAPGDIARVETTVSDIALSVLPYGVPETRTEALFSVPWCAAAALSDGALGIGAFEPAALAREDLRALAARVSVSAHPRAPGVAFHPAFPDVVTVYLKDGRALTHKVAYPIGSPARPLDADALANKFVACLARGGIGLQPAQHAFARIMSGTDATTVKDALSFTGAPVL